MKAFSIQLKSKTHRSVLNVLIHVFAWLVIIYLPLLSSAHPPTTVGDYMLRMLPSVASALVFYGNFFLIIPYLFIKKRGVLFILSNLLLYALVTVFLGQFSSWIIDNGYAEMKVPPLDGEFILRFNISFIAISGIAVAVKVAGEWFRSEEQKKDLEQEHLKSELANLKNQLNPHFFFNTLNTIYGLIIKDQEKAQQAVHLLSKLMRYLLYDSNEKFVSLSKELSFLYHYIELMQLRAPDRMQVEMDFPTNPPPYSIAPLLFISLIENAFKHGSSLDQSTEISIHLKVDDGKQITFVVLNRDFAKADNDRSGSGIGIENLKKRLQLLYPEAHLFTTRSFDGYYEAKLILQL